MSSLTSSLMLGFLQGVLEWLPVSSEGNLAVLMMTVLDMNPDDVLSYGLFLHLGTGMSALIYLRNDLWSMVKMESKDDRVLARHLVLSTAVTGLIGLPLFLFVEISAVYGETLISLTGVALILTGLIQKGASEKGVRGSQSLTLMNGLLLGLAQGLSVIPGISRSGITVSALLFLGYSGIDSFRISFLMSVPATFAAVTGLYLIGGIAITSESFIGVLTAFIVGYLSIDALLVFARKTNFWKVCIFLGVLSLLSLLPALL